MNTERCVAEVNQNFQRYINDFDNALRLNFYKLIYCLGVSRVTLYLLQENEAVIYPKMVMTERGEVEASGFISIGQNARNYFGKAFKTGKVIVKPGYPEYSVYVPLVNEKVNIGILVLDNFKTQRTLKRKNINDISKFIEPFRQGVANCLHYQRFHSQIRKLTTLMRIAGVMAIALKLEEVLKITLNSLVKDMGYDRAQIFLFDDQSGSVTRHVSFDFRDKYESQEKVSGNIEPYLAEITPSHFSKKYSSDVICYTPMFWKGKKIGVLIVDNLFSREALKTDDFSFLGILANQLGILIENSLLFEKVEQSSITDGLTGLYNHRQFYNLLSEEIARADRTGAKLSLLMCDIDHFKKFNDTFGHQAGDKVLMMLAETIKQSVRAIDISSRYGGEEFAIILPSADAAHSKEIAARINEHIRKAELMVDGKSLRVTVSVGIATYPEDSNEKADLVRKADKALYWSKNHGRDAVSIYSEIK